MEDNIRRASIIIALEQMRRSFQLPHESSIPRQSNREGGESGSQYIHRLLNENATLCQVQLRLDRNMFVRLVNLMVERNLLADAKYISVAEQVGICLYILAKGVSYRDASDNFKHSISTISKYFRQVLDALVILSYDIIRPHRDLSEIPPEIADSSRYWPYFKDAVGAIDGTHIQAVIRDEEGVPFRNHHGSKSWNVLACCSFDRIFTFINVGWEGSAHDIAVWRDSLTNSKYGFPHPPEGKYYMVDSGYPNTLGYLSPIRDTGIRCHMPEFKHGKPKGMEENYNHLHSSLRMKVEMAFGQLKKKWKVLKNMPQMSKQYQMSIIVSTFTLHNFIRMCTLGIPIIQHGPNVDARVDSDMFNTVRKNAMNAVRNIIAQQIWQSRLAGIEDGDDDDEVEENDEVMDDTEEDN